jgi:hypothetical protein
MRKKKVEKVCPKCKVKKNIEESFYIGVNKRDGCRSISSYCIDCWKSFELEPKRKEERKEIMKRNYSKRTGRSREEIEQYVKSLKENAPIKKCNVYYNKCIVTGYIHTSREKNLHYISETGFAIYNAWTKKERQTLLSNVRNKTKVYRCCAVCGKHYNTIKSLYHTINSCSKECSTEQKRINKRISKTKRNKRLGQGRERAKRLGALVQNVERIKIFQRDKFKCWICGNKTDKNSIGKCNDNSPTLDHVQPLVHGGNHTATNLKTACFKCNSVRQHNGTFNYQLSI